jgi:hypothetical protein
MAHKPRPRRTVSPRRLRMLRVVGFRYSASRDAYVLRLIGNRLGPVYKVAPGPDRAPDAPKPSSPPGSTRMA